MLVTIWDGKRTRETGTTDGETLTNRMRLNGVPGRKNDPQLVPAADRPLSDWEKEKARLLAQAGGSNLTIIRTATTMSVDGESRALIGK